MALVVTLFGVSACSSLVVALREGAEVGWPSLFEIAGDLGVGWLMGFMWAVLGAAMAIGLRAVALPTGSGSCGCCAVQNLITALGAPGLGWVDAVQEWLPGLAAGSLVADRGGRTDTLGVTELATAPQSVLVLVGYLIVFTAIGCALFRRRDRPDLQRVH